MLVHKKTHGVLDRVWNAAGTALIPATFENCKHCDLSPSEWWYVQDGSALSKRLTMSYPDFEPIVNPDDGALVDIFELRNAKRAANIKEENRQKKEQMKADAVKRGYAVVYKKTVQPNSLAFLGPTLRRRKK